MEGGVTKDKFGQCHICGTPQYIRWCGLCKHWFCADCRVKPAARALAAVKEVINGPLPNCCGPYSED